MSLIDPFSVATSGLANVNRSIGIVSHNIANAATPGYVRETQTQRALSADGQVMGVATGLTTRDIDTALQTRLLTQNATAAGAAARSDALAQIDAAHGQPGAGDDIAALLGKVKDGFSTLATEPGSAPQQRAVVEQAAALTARIRDIAGTVGALRQNAQDELAAGVGALNGALARIGDISKQIILVRTLGASTADLESQRDAVAQEASGYVELRFMPRPSGDMVVFTSTGLELPTHSTQPPLAIASATMTPAGYYPGGGAPALTLNGLDVTGQFNTGTLGALITLRDTTLPIHQGELDEFAITLSRRFAAQGLGLFTDASGTVPVGGGVPRQGTYIGYANKIQVHPAIDALPSLVRDGTASVVATAGGPLAFTPNPAGGPAGFTDLITRIVSYALGDQVAPGVDHPAPDLSAMGPTGTQNRPVSVPRALTAFAAALISAETTDAANATTAKTATADIQTVLKQSMADRSGVDMDAELAKMVQLQNAYSANARVITTLQAMWSQLLQAIA